jgi:hypothetical protein
MKGEDQLAQIGCRATNASMMPITNHHSASDKAIIGYRYPNPPAISKTMRVNKSKHFQSKRNASTATSGNIVMNIELTGIYPLPVNGGAATKVLLSLLKKKLIEEVPAKLNDEFLREHKKCGRLTFRATAAADEALGIDEDAAASKPRAKATAPEAERTQRGGKERKRKESVRATRADSKQAKLIEMLKAPKGATVEEMAKALDWQAHTVRGALAGGLKKRLGFAVTSEKVEGRGRVYRLRSPPDRSSRRRAQNPAAIVLG